MTLHTHTHTHTHICRQRHGDSLSVSLFCSKSANLRGLLVMRNLRNRIAITCSITSSRHTWEGNQSGLGNLRGEKTKNKNEGVEEKKRPQSKEQKNHGKRERGLG